jgi:putative NADPH-quinone reductase
MGKNSKRVLIVNGNPDTAPERFSRALVAAYQRGAEAAGHSVQVVHLAELDFPWLRSYADFETGSPPAVIAQQQEKIAWADHLVIIYPLWLGAMPALLKAYLEQVLRPGFAFAYQQGLKFPRKLLAGRSARIFVTMGMPSLFYKLYSRAHTLKSLEQTLKFVGFKPIAATVIGNIGGMSASARSQQLTKAKSLGVRVR